MLFLVPLLCGSKSPSEDQHVIEHTHGLASSFRKCGYIAAAMDGGLGALLVVVPPLPALPPLRGLFG
jgi:hypothetical protein